MNTNNKMGPVPVSAVILAGGRGQRMGGQDKGLVQYRGRALIEYTIAALKPQVSEIVINCNRNVEHYRKYGMACVADAREDFLGPLAGMQAGIGAAHNEYVLFVPVDSPHLPSNLAQRLFDACNEAGRKAVCVHDGERLQPLFAMLHRDFTGKIDSALQSGKLKLIDWCKENDVMSVDFSDTPGAFANINTPAQLNT